jgi:hypothetical protein
MASGDKTMVINTQERAISPDINRLQAFASKDRAELLRYLLDVTGSDDFDAGGVITEHTTLESPLRAEVINGLLVRPTGGNLVLAVDPGVLYAIAPDSGPDDSNYKFVEDPGTSNGTLTMTANASGSTRIDVIECQLTPTIVETDNRDIYDPTTGLFSATSVTKATQMLLTYRVRLGTPGSGFPGTASGWLPLAVATVPNGTTTNDAITFWDVRPLIWDREFAPTALRRSWPRQPYARYQGATSPITGASNYVVSGMLEVMFDGRRYGGEIRRGTPGTDAVSIDFEAAANLASGYSFPAANTMVFAYLVAPQGLPRWARYTDGPSGRVPRSPRGIIVVCGIAPNVDGTPSTAIAMPDSTGFATTETNALCIFMGLTETIGGHVTFYPMESGGKVIAGVPYSPKSTHTISPTASSNSFATYLLTAGTHFPANAKRVQLRFNASFTTDTTNPQTWSPYAVAIWPNGDTTSGHTVWTGPNENFTVFPVAGTPNTHVSNFDVWVTVSDVYPSGSNSTFTFQVEHDYNVQGAGAGSVSGQNLKVIGYEL